jgi:Domain of unknown function (DUF1929)
MKKIALAFSVSLLLAACGGGRDEATQSAPVAAAPAATAASAATSASASAEKSGVVQPPADAEPAHLRMRILAGAESSAGVFVDRLNANERVTAIRVCAGAYIDSLQVSTNQRVFAKRGGDGGACQDFNLAAGETITRVFGGAGLIVDRLGFGTSTGRTLGPIGGSGGRPFSMSIASGSGMVFRGLSGATGVVQGARLLGQINLIGDLTGGDGGSAFIDRMLPDERVVDAVICYRPGAFVQSVQLRTNVGWRAKHGTDSPSATCETARLADGEYITELFGAAGDYVNAIGFATSTGRAVGPLGGPGGTGFSQSAAANGRFTGWYGRSGGWLDKIGLMTPPTGEVGPYTFADQLPTGARIGAVEVCVADGFNGRVVRSVQAITDAGRRLPLNGGRRQTGGNTTCQSVNFAAGEWVTEMFGAANMAIDSVGFRTNTGREIGPIGGTGGIPFLLRNPSSAAFLGFAGRFVYDSYLATLDFAATDVFAPTAPADAQAPNVGWWGDMLAWPLNAIHANLLPDGRLLTYGTDASGTQGAQFVYDVWNPVLGTAQDSHLTLDNTTGTDLFCSAQTLLASGNVLLAGGDNRQASVPGGYNGFNRGVVDANIFSPGSNSLAPTSKLNSARWYASQTMLPSGRVLVTGGIDAAGVFVAEPEVYTPGAGWKRLPGAANAGAFSRFYPRVFIDPLAGAQDQVYVVATDSNKIYRVNVDADAGRGSVVDTNAVLPENHGWQRASAMVAPGRVLLQLDSGSTVEVQLPTTAGGTPTVTAAGKLTQARIWANFINLPTGEVLAIGGSAEANAMTSVAYHGEIWSPATKTWRVVASELRPRLYHSNAMLLPDGRVLSAGGGSPGPVLNLNAQTYSPPYLYAKGSGALAARPVISSAPGALAFGGAIFNVQTPQAAAISRVTFTRLGSTTHSFDFDTRFMELAITQRSAAALSVQGPASNVQAPPGRYLLTLIDSNGVPSVSRVVALN